MCVKLQFVEGMETPGQGLEGEQFWQDERKRDGNEQLKADAINGHCCCAQSCVARGEANLRSGEGNRNSSESRTDEVMEGKGYGEEVAEDTCNDGEIEGSVEGG
jgi:hypothetical protein